MYLVWKILGTLGHYVDNESIPLKIIFISVLKLRALAPLQIPASLCKGPIFYFYARVSSIPSRSNLLFSWQASCDGERSKNIWLIRLQRIYNFLLFHAIILSVLDV